MHESDWEKLTKNSRFVRFLNVVLPVATFISMLSLQPFSLIPIQFFLFPTELSRIFIYAYMAALAWIMLAPRYVLLAHRLSASLVVVIFTGRIFGFLGLVLDGNTDLIPAIPQQIIMMSALLLWHVTGSARLSKIQRENEVKSLSLSGT